MERSHDVALGNPRGKDFNTIVLSGVDLTVPLEMDLDDDPLQDDEVRLRSEDGHYEKILLASDADARPDPDKRLVLYTFRLVPPGAYRIAVRIGAEKWLDVVTDLVVTKQGAFLGDKKLGTEPERVAEETAEEPADDPPDEAPEEEELGEFVDVNDGFFEEGER
ncbi:hypothetical protein [Polyangium spumosum]|uniref:Uncharacterized protein n=1 Tax=Polyangium spumosum TaxID=889282 RepID=A0A6N7PKR7_9BACT|nr:hypothetical protein [Polyangium spumosum]MRG90705.1 hypothetical protein [Polyangium spumosum]